MSSIQYEFRPLPRWPRPSTPAHERKDGPFKVPGRYVAEGYGPTATKRWTFGKPTPVTQTYRDLQREVGHLGVAAGERVYISAGFRDRDIRLDGLPKADARQPEHPGVMVHFRSRTQGPLEFACDDCRRWEDNLRAIVLTMERLRLANLYGVTKRGEQYQGFKALPPAAGSSSDEAPMTLEEAAAFVVKACGHDYPADVLIRSVDNFRSAYRIAAMKTHPDRNPDKSEAGLAAWHRLQRAKELLEQAHGGV